MKRPLVTVALLYVGGILLADSVALPLPWLFAGSLGVAAMSLCITRARGSLLVPLLVLAGVTNLTFRTAIISPHDLRTVVGRQTVYVTIKGTLAETPGHRIYEQDEQESWRTLARVDVAAVRVHNQPDWRPALGRVAVSTPGILPAEYTARQPVQITGVLRQPNTALAEGLFDYRNYLRRRGIHYQLQVASPGDWQIVGVSPAPNFVALADRFAAWARQTLGRGLPAEDEPLRLLWAMTLGWRTALTGEVSEPFMRSGTIHIFAISGLHVAAIAGILVGLLRVVQVPRAACGVVVIPLLWFYCAATGWQPSAIRSTIMMSVIIAGWALRRPSDLLNSLAAAAFIILLWEPRQLFHTGFQLSFFVVLSIGLLLPPLEKLRARLLQTDPLLPRELLPRWQRRLHAPVRWVTTCLATSLAAWLGSIPLVAYYFHLFVPVTLLANLIVVPLSGLAIMSALGSFFTGAWFPAGSELFSHSAWFVMSCMVSVSEWAARLPGAYFYVRPPTFLTFALYYALVISVLAGWLARPRWRGWVAGGLAVLSAVWLVEWQRERLATHLTILPLGGGNAIYLDAPGRQNDLLIDCGNESAVEFVVKPFLRAQGVNHLNALLLTHGDLRHIGGAGSVTTNFAVSQLLTSSIRFRSPTYRKIVQSMETSPERWREINRGEQIGPWTVLHPEPTDRFPQADDNALVLLGAFGQSRVLLLSDLGRPGQNALMERNGDLRADVVIAGLPVQTEPLCEALLDAVQPRVIIITDAEFPATERANPKLRERLGQRNVPVIYTRSVGAVKLTLREKGWTLKTADGTRFSSLSTNEQGDK